MALNTIQTAQRTGFEGCHGAQDLRVNMTLLSANGDDAFTPFWSFVLLLFSFVHRSYLQRPEVGSTDHWMERKEHAWTERKRWNRYTKSMKRMKDRLRMCFRGCGFSIWGGGYECLLELNHPTNEPILSITVTTHVNTASYLPPLSAITPPSPPT